MSLWNQKHQSRTLSPPDAREFIPERMSLRLIVVQIVIRELIKIEKMDLLF